MNFKFNLLNKTYEVNEYYSRLLANYPKKQYILKQSIEATSYNLIECLFAYNIYNAPRVKEKYIREYLVELSMLDYYTRDSFFKKIISKKQYEVLGKKFVELKKMAYGVIKKDEDESEI